MSKFEEWAVGVLWFFIALLLVLIAPFVIIYNFFFEKDDAR